MKHILLILSLIIISFITIKAQESDQNRSSFDYSSTIEVKKKAKLNDSPYAIFGDNTAVLKTNLEEKKDHSLKIPIIENDKQIGLFELDFQTGIVSISNKGKARKISKQLSTEELARFTGIDPMAEKYYSISPYVYVANNPMKYTDPTGMWILLKNGDNSYRYENGQLYEEIMNAKTKKLEYRQYTPIQGSAIEGLFNGLNDLVANSKTGALIVDYFSNDQLNIGIQVSKNADIQGNHVDLGAQGHPDIYMKTNFSGSMMPTERGIQQSPFWLDLGHELAHGVDWVSRGASAGSTQDGLMISSGDILKRTEIFATYMENNMRAESNIPLRTHYFTNTENTMGKGPLLIDNNRGSTFINSVFFPKVSLLKFSNRK